MITMRQDGYLKVLEGKSNLMEVDRVASSDS
jgi:type II secretory ATPase GspE/PulE/Tfp pilus assembly ATPase PilB-like protein